MGQGGNHPIADPAPTIEEVNRHVDLLFGELSATTKVDPINQSILIVSRNLSQNGSFSQKETGFFVNPTLLRCIYHSAFEKTIKSLIALVNSELKGILESKLMALVPRERFRKTLNLANFCIFFINESLIQTVNLLSVRSDLDPSTRDLIREYNKDNPEINHQIIDSIQGQELSDMAKMLRVSISTMIDLHLKLITRSDFTLKIVDRLSQSTFVLYCHIFFSTLPEVRKREIHENTKTLIKIGAYFLGQGIQTNCASVYELSVLLLQSVLGGLQQQLKSQKALPSHLFKSLPIVSHNQMIHWMASTILFALKYVKHENTFYSRMNFNRICSLKLLQIIFSKLKPHDHQLTYLLEDLCLQTKAFQIERVYVVEIAKLYAQTDSSSDIIKKYAQLDSLSYNIKGAHKQVKIRPEDVRTELEDDEDSVRKQMLQLSNKFTLQVIFQKSDAVYEYSDKALWNSILYHMQEEGTDFQKPKAELNKEGEEEQP